MRYAKDHKEQARAAILAAAGRRLKEKGFHGVGVDGLASAAEVTSGAIYSHFGSKEGFLEQVIRANVSPEFDALEVADTDERRRRLVALVYSYLSEEHCEGVADGCVLTALTADVARAGDSVREVYQLQISRMVALVLPAMPGDFEEQRRRAWALVAAIVGAVSVARALPAGAHRDAVLQSTLRSIEESIARS
ncbi:DNA-binding transcriptional regulator, AcrR family [Lentzea waywayandensis]|uniref:DNA-binding transcriptional regulator, AcrR family n=1 Tax=Lentzea waywayandensis TaxID=84724 RepID=A0A1I6DM69_9PSEU|nr:TetR/AcrR family transcriptional regulator [Lentzea waywayandensis]SFR06458.1 DNA-binding transcriptional regulator, AcrR family [Lentzea waywayandensis]